MFIVCLLVIQSALSQDFTALETELLDLKQLIEDNYMILSNSVKKSQDLGRDSRLIISKSSKAQTRLQQSADVLVYSTFNTEIQRKHLQIEPKVKNSNNLISDQVFTKKIRMNLDYFSHKQKPTPAFQEDFTNLEQSLKTIKETINQSYDLSTLYLFLLLLSLGLIFLWKNVKIAQKRHYL
jgi:hypothetical protein